MVHFRKAHGMSVATIREGLILGKLDDLQFELEGGRIFGYRLKQGVFAKSGGVPAEALVLFGQDLVLVRAEEDVEWSGVARAATEGRAWATEYRGTTIMSRRGEDLGTVEDYLLDPAVPFVRALVLEAGRLVVLDDRVALRRDAVIVDDASVLICPPVEAEAGGDWWRRVRGLFESDE